MTKSNKLILTLVALVGIMVIATLTYNSISKRTPDALPAPDSSSETQPTRTPFPDFTIESLSGEEVKLSELNDKVVLINFWATWCGFCVDEMPHFQKFYEQYGDKVQFMMINATDGSRETEEKARKFIEEKGYTFPVYLDRNIELVTSLGLSSYPTTVFIDKEGFISEAKLGMYTEEQLKDAIERHLEEQ